MTDNKMSTGYVPKKIQGQWALKQRGRDIDIVCSRCNYVRLKSWAYGYKVEEVEKEFESQAHPNFCENCGANMTDENTSLEDLINSGKSLREISKIYKDKEGEHYE